MNHLRAMICCCLIASFGIVATSKADWTEIDDFEDGFGFTGTPVTLEDENATPPTNNGWLVAGTLTTSSRKIITDPDGLHPNNEVMAIAGGAGLGISKPGSVSVADGSTATLFFRYRFLSTTSTAKPSIGVSMNDAGVTAGGSGPYMLVGDNTSSTYRLQGYNPSAVGITDVDPDAWYSIWMVVHNNSSPATDTVELYLQRDDGTGLFGTQTQLTWDNGGTPSTAFAFRTNKSATLTNFFFRTNDNHQGQRTIYFDDVYYDNTGVVLTSPVTTATPGDFDGDGDVDGADFIVWQTNFPAENGHNLATGDADGDTDVDGADFAAWQGSFPFAPGLGATPIPEPCSIGLAIFGVLVIVARRRLIS